MTRDWIPILKNILTNFVERDFEALEKLEWLIKIRRACSEFQPMASDYNGLRGMMYSY